MLKTNPVSAYFSLTHNSCDSRLYLYFGVEEPNMLDKGNLWIGIILVVFGILILAVPDLIRWLVGIALLVIGILYIVRHWKQ